MDEVLSALSGDQVVVDERVLIPPEPLQSPVASPSRSDKTVYGTHYANYIDSEHFSVNWSDGNGNQNIGQLVSDAMEEAWYQLVEQQGWTPPVSSDDYLLWVVLDSNLSGTGLTTEYYSGDFPDGYPVMWINPQYFQDYDFFTCLCAHEFGHALQFALREGYSGDEESWFWEASAMWQCKLTFPDDRSYADQAYYYATQPGLTYSSMSGYHQYGMFPVNLWLDEFVVGEGATKEIWELSNTMDNATWDDIIEASTGVSASEVWAGWTGAYGNEQFDDSQRYWSPNTQGTVEDGSTGSVTYLGTDYWLVSEDGAYEATGDVVLAGSEGPAEKVAVQNGDTLSVTGTSTKQAQYTLLATTIETDENKNGGSLRNNKSDAGCDCAATPSTPWQRVWFWPIAMWVFGRRKEKL